MKHTLDGDPVHPMLTFALDPFVLKLSTSMFCHLQIGKENKTHCNNPPNTINKGFMLKKKVLGGLNQATGSYPEKQSGIWAPHFFPPTLHPVLEADI